MQYNDELKALQADIQRKEHICSKLEFLKNREQELIVTVASLRTEMNYECYDVERLEGTNAVSLFYTIIGKKTEQLDKEKKEAILATEKFKLAEAELNEVSHDIEKCNKELKYISKCEEKFIKLREKTIEATINADVDGDSELLDLNEQARQTEARIAETDEALSEGEKLFSLIDEISELLHDYLMAVNNSRGRNRSEIAKIEAHEKLKLADSMLSGLPAQITRFRAELADVDIEFDVEAEIYSYSLVGASNYYADLFISSTNGVYDVLHEFGKLKPETSKLIFRLGERKKRLSKNLSYIQSKINKIISL